MLWSCIHLPHAPLEALLPLPADWLADGVMVVEKPGAAAPVVVAASAAAQARGVRPGQGAALAAALAPGVRACPRQPQREAALIEHLALALSRYTPQVVLEPDGVLLELRSSLRLFGGLRRLLPALAGSTLETAGGVGEPRLGLAPTPLAASLLARLAPAPASPWPAGTVHTRRLPAWLGPLPALAALEVLVHLGRLDAPQARSLSELLEGSGCTTLAAVRQLPRAGLSRRAGRALLAALDTAWGEAPDPQRPYLPPPGWQGELELLHRADDAAMLVFAVQRLLQPLAAWLARQWLAATCLALHLRHESSTRSDRPAQPDTVLRVELAQPSRDPAQWLAVLRERLQRLPLPAPVYHLRLVLDTVQTHAGTQAQWLPDAQAQAEGWARLLDRLRARLGDGAVQRLALQADHRPERAVNILPAGAAPGPALPPPPPPAPARPGWLLDPPQALHSLGEQPRHGGPLKLLSGPERIEAGWFDGALAVRDYFIAEGTDHRLRWIYREAGPAGPAWFLHGWFA